MKAMKVLAFIAGENIIFRIFKTKNVHSAKCRFSQHLLYRRNAPALNVSPLNKQMYIHVLINYILCYFLWFHHIDENNFLFGLFIFFPNEKECIPNATN